MERKELLEFVRVYHIKVEQLKKKLADENDEFKQLELKFTLSTLKLLSEIAEKDLNANHNVDFKHLSLLFYVMGLSDIMSTNIQHQIHHDGIEWNITGVLSGKTLYKDQEITPEILSLAFDLNKLTKR